MGGGGGGGGDGVLMLVVHTPCVPASLAVHSQVAFEAEHRNPFLFERIKHLSSSHFDDVGACVVMATPSMMQSGVSRDLFEAWCDDKRWATSFACTEQSRASWNGLDTRFLIFQWLVTVWH